MRMNAVRQASAARGVGQQPAAVILDQLERARLPGVDRVVGRFERQHEQREAAVVDAVDGAFVGIDQAQVGGNSPACATARTARAPARKSSNASAAPARKVGRSCRRSQASVITPSAPSEPIIRRSGLGPAPEPGRRRLSITPAGVTTRRLSTKSSIWV